MSGGEAERWAALVKKTGKNIPPPPEGVKPDWSLFDDYRDMPVEKRPKTYTIGGGRR